jgi:peptidoglycan/LPS O-acetylase OafA/YrhL
VFHFLWLEVTSETLTRFFSTPHGTIQVAIRALISMPVELGLTVMTAVLSYKFLEKPFLKLKERFTVIRSRAV